MNTQPLLSSLWLLLKNVPMQRDGVGLAPPPPADRSSNSFGRAMKGRAWGVAPAPPPGLRVLTPLQFRFSGYFYKAPTLFAMGIGGR